MYLPYHFVVSDCSNVVKGGVYVGFEVSNGRGIGGFFFKDFGVLEGVVQ